MSEFNAFSGGIAPGGLRSQNDIRILICYLLQSVPAPLSEEDLTKILQEKSLANFFEIKDALASLITNHHIEKDAGGNMVICESGREIASNLDVTLPLSVRDKALEAAVKLLARAKNEREHKVDIIKTNAGYQVRCHISGGNLELMGISLYVPDEKQALLVKEQFFRDPGSVYTLLLAALTGEKEFSAESFTS